MLDVRDLEVTVLIARHGSFAKAARALNITVPAVSKRLAGFETRLGVRLFDRSTRRVAPTTDGEAIIAEAREVLDRMADMEALATRRQRAPTGHLRVNGTQGFGRRVLAPLLSEFARTHADITIDLTLTQGLPLGPEVTFDLAVRLGKPADENLVAKKLAANERVLVAAPRYLKKAGMPKSVADLAKHRCLAVREGNSDFATWSLEGPTGMEKVRVAPQLASNDGESVVGWALDGHGILLRSAWDIAPLIREKRLTRVLPTYAMPADVYAMYINRRFLPPRVDALINFLTERLAGKTQSK
jgi:LysR family transcriptional regulator, transcriptional activator for dmlA